MAGNLLQIGNSDGKIRIKSNGVIVAGVGDPCCCVATCSECASGTTPATIRCVVSGVTLCGTCKSSLVASLDADVSASVDGTFDAVQQSGTPCFYQVKLFDINTYSYSSGCTGSPVGTTGVYLNVTLQGTAIQVVIGFTLPTGFGSVEYDYFSGTISVSAGYDCSASRTATNAITCAGGSLGENGTVDIVGI